LSKQERRKQKNGKKSKFPQSSHIFSPDLERSD